MTRKATIEEIYSYTRDWARMMETSFLMQLVNGRQTALPFKTVRVQGRAVKFTTFEDMRGVVPARHYTASPAPPGRIARDVLEGFCANEIDARIPARA